MEKALFWDFDGTLIYSISAWTKAMLDALASHGCEADFTEVRIHSGHTVGGFSWHAPYIAYPEATGYSWWERLFEHYHILYDRLAVPEASYPSIDKRFRENILIAERYNLYDDTLETLARCGEIGFSQYILSNNFPELSDIVEQLGMGKYIKETFVSAQLGYEKPHAAIYEHALARAGHPKEVYMIGDNPAADIQGAVDVGIPAILVHKEADCPAIFKTDRLDAIPGFLSTRS